MAKVESNAEASSRLYMNDMLDMTQDVQEFSKPTGDSEVAKFFEGLNVFVTGGSGFVGKLLIEKLLRSCPKIGKLYMLLRPKKGKTIEERFKDHFDVVIYERLKKERPNFISQVVVVEGDTGLDDLGLSVKDRVKLIDNVDVVFHGAATVRFDESFGQAVKINVRGTKRVLQLAKEMKHLKACVHVSTAFSNCIYETIEEQFYEPPMDPDKCLALVDLLDDDLLEHMKTKAIGKWPNTYAFSKALGEAVVRQEKAELPVCIVRPSIMMATYREPIPGWINNYYGATGVVVGAGLGILRSLYCDSSKIADIIPADYVINNIIVAAWDVAKRWEEKQKELAAKGEKEEKVDDPIIYNSVSSCQMPIDWGTFMHFSETYGEQVPSNMAIWCYFFTLNKYLWVHNLYSFFLHTIPAIIVDAVALSIGRKPILFKTYQKIHKFSWVIAFFCTNQWTFNNKQVVALWNRTNPVDRELFDFNLKNLDWSDYFYHEIRGLRVYIAKDPLSTVESARRYHKKLRYAHYTLETIFGILLAWTVFNILRFILSCF